MRIDSISIKNYRCYEQLDISLHERLTLFVGKNGAQLYADELIWQGQDQDILANGNVQFIQDGKIVTKSKNAVFNSDLTVFKIIGKTKTELYADKKDKKKYAQL